MINFIGITKDNLIEHTISLDTIDLTLFRWFWIDFNEPTEEEVKHLEDTFKFHPLAIEDCTQQTQSPKLDHYEDHIFCITHAIYEKENEITQAEVDFFLKENYLVSFHWIPVVELNQVWNKLLTHKNVDKVDTYYVFYQILDTIVDNYFPYIYKIEEELETIVVKNKSMNHLMIDLFNLRHMLLKLRHIVHPMSDLLTRLLNSHHLDGIMERKEYYSDIYDNLINLSDMITANRKITADIRDSYLSLNSHQTNRVMKILTIITSIFSPLTFIAGVYGMNFAYMPELTWKYGYFLVLAVMAIIGVIMYFWFKSKGWLK